MNDVLDEYECNAVPHVFGPALPDPVGELQREERRQRIQLALALVIAIVLTLASLTYHYIQIKAMS